MHGKIDNLSDTEVRAAKYEDKIYRLYDGGGLYDYGKGKNSLYDC